MPANQMLPEPSKNPPEASPTAGLPSKNPDAPTPSLDRGPDRHKLPYAEGNSSGIMEYQQTQIWQGQFPPPEAIERYEKALPGAFDRIMKMAETQQAAQIREVESAQLYTSQDMRRGQWLGFLTTGLAIAGAIVCSYLHQLLVAGGLLSVPVMAVAKSLVEGLKSRKHDADG